MATATDRRAGARSDRRGSRRAAAAALVVAATLHPAPSTADSMRCGSRLVKDDDTIEKVLDTCGEPVTKERTWILRQPRYELGSHEYSFPGTEEVPVDTWTYDFGPNKLMQRVRFVAGKVDSITTLGKGASEY